MDHKIYLELIKYTEILKTRFPERLTSSARYTIPYILFAIDNSLSEYEKISGKNGSNKEDNNKD